MLRATDDRLLAYLLLRLPLAAILIVSSLAYGAVSPAAGAETRLKIGVVGTNESQLPIRLAIDQGFFEQQNIDVETIEFRGGGIAIQAFVGGSIDLCTCATDHVVRLNNRGIDARLLIGIDRFITNALIAPADAGYTDLASLRGRNIGVSAPGSYSDNTLRWAIRQAGLDPDRDFVILGTGQGTAGRAALETKQIAALVVPTPDVLDYQFTTPGRYKVLVDWRTIDHSGQAVIGRQRWADANPAVARGVVRAVTMAEQVIQNDPSASARVFKTIFPGRSDDYIKALTAEVAPRLSPDGRISHSGFLKMIEIMQIIEPGLKPVRQADVDLQPVLSR
jgi:NitT/TauT family transport system substrate-binding protein